MLFAVLGLGLAIDLAAKSWSFANVAPRPVILDRQLLQAHPLHNPIDPHPGIRVLPADLLEMQLVINRGAVFGIGANQRFFFIGFTIAALAVGLFVFGTLTAHNHRLAHVAIGFILAGGVGNLYDRIMYGVVRDFLHMLPGHHLPFNWRWPGGSPELFPWVFNVADVMLLTGMALLLLHMSRVDRRRQAAAAEASALANATSSGTSSS
jgi:signal peptidase II